MMMILMMAAINRCFICVIILHINLDTVMFQHSEDWVTAFQFVAVCQIKC